MSEDRAVHTAGPIGVLAEQLSEPATQSRSLIGALVRFAITGGASVGADFVVLVFLRSVLHTPLIVGTLAGYALSLVVNYSLNRNWTFPTAAGHRRTLYRYLVVVGFNVVSTVLLVLGHNVLGVPYPVSKLIAVAINAVFNFLTGRYWIFAQPTG